MTPEEIKALEARLLAKIAERQRGMTDDERIRHQARILLNSEGRQLKVGGVTRTIVAVRVTYGAGIELTLNLPLPGKTSSLVTVGARMAQAGDLIGMLT